MLHLKSLLVVLVFLFCSIASSNARPEWFVPPPLDPSGVKLETVELYDGVFLMSNTPFADNDFVLVIDHFAIWGSKFCCTDNKIFVNLNAFGDHVFGNYVFPESTKLSRMKRL